MPVFQGEDDTSWFDSEFTEQEPVLSPGIPAGSKNLFRGFSFVAPSVLYGTNLFNPEDSMGNLDPKREAFFGKYKLTSDVIGTGGFSICKRCTKVDTGVNYACKIISRAKCETRMIDAEIQMLQKCGSHPNVISLQEHFSDNHHTYLVMPLCTGGELLDRIKSKTKFSEIEACRIFKKLVTAVVFLHKNGIVHRDLKSENLLYVSKAEDSEIKIVDFGFAKEIGSLAEKMKTPCFTDTHAAPEVLANYHAQMATLPEDVDAECPALSAPRLPTPAFAMGSIGGASSSAVALGYDSSCDLWSLGVILYTMLCGYPPFFSRKKTLSSFEILQRITETNQAGSGVPFPDAQWQHVSKEAKSLVNGLMTIDPTRRLTTSGVRKHPWIKEHEPGHRLSRRDSVLLTPSVLQIGVLGDVDYLAMNRKRRRSRGYFNDSVNHLQRASRQYGISEIGSFATIEESTRPDSADPIDYANSSFGSGDDFGGGGRFSGGGGGGGGGGGAAAASHSSKSSGGGGKGISISDCDSSGGGGVGSDSGGGSAAASESKRRKVAEGLGSVQENSLVQRRKAKKLSQSSNASESDTSSGGGGRSSLTTPLSDNVFATTPTTTPEILKPTAE